MYGCCRHILHRLTHGTACWPASSQHGMSHASFRDAPPLPPIGHEELCHSIAEFWWRGIFCSCTSFIGQSAVIWLETRAYCLIDIWIPFYSCVLYYFWRNLHPLIQTFLHFQSQSKLREGWTNCLNHGTQFSTGAIFQCLILRVGVTTFIQFGDEIETLVALPTQVSNFEQIASFRNWSTSKAKLGQISLFWPAVKLGRS